MSFRRQKEGSITLEAAIAMPFFVAFIIAMIVMTKMAIFQMALQSATNTTVQQMATHIYPAYVLMGEMKQTELGEKATSYVNKTSSTWGKIKESEEFLRSLGINLTFTGTVEAAVEQAVQAIECTAATPIVRAYADSRVLDTRKLTVTRVVFDDEYLAIEAQYQYTMAIPFFSRTVNLKALSTERMWNQCSDYARKPKDTSQAKFVGTINSNKYHILNAPCIGRDAIYPENLVYFYSEEEAIKANRVLCQICAKQLEKQQK